MFPFLVSLKGFEGEPRLSTRKLFLNLKAFQGIWMESIHPFACLTLLPMAEEIDVRWVNFEAGDWPLNCRPNLKRLRLRSEQGIKFGQLKQLFKAILNVTELKLILHGGVDGFDEEVLTL